MKQSVLNNKLGKTKRTDDDEERNQNDYLSIDTRP
jgi:hypothetical protein